MRRPLHVVHAALSLDAGGLERVVLSLIGEGDRLGQRLSVVCLERPGSLATEAEARGVVVTTIGKRPGHDPGAMARCRGVLSALRPDVLHVHQLGALLYIGLAARISSSCPIIHTQHGSLLTPPPRRRWVGRLAASFAHRFCCVSRSLAEEAVSLGIAPRHKVVTLPNGIDLAERGNAPAPTSIRQSLGIPTAAPVVGTVGRLHESKRIDRLLFGFARLRHCRPDAHLLIVGDGPMRESLQRLANRLELDGTVHFVGHQHRPWAHLAAMDSFAMTSQSEGMPLAVLEAWAAGRPVVAVRAKGLTDLIRHGRDGLLVSPDDPAALASALYGLIEAPVRAAQLGGEGRRRVEADHDVGTMANRYARLYEELFVQKHVDRPR